MSYQLLWNYAPVGSIKFINADDKPGDILTLELPVSLLSEGKHRLAYRVTVIENHTVDDSLSSSVEVDLTPPGNPLLAPIIFPTSVDDGLTSNELEQMGNVLAATVAGYTGMQTGDLIQTYWGNAEGPVVTVDADDMGLKRVMVDFPRAFLEAMGDGKKPVHYTVTDQAGNQSMNAESVTVDLQLALVVPLPTPTVKEAVGDTLDPADTLYGARVVIDASANLRANEVVSIQWTGPGASDTQSKVISENEAGREITVLFDSTLVSANAGETVKILYKVHRTSGQEQTSETLSLRVIKHLSALPAPRMDTVNAEGVVVPDRIPASGATVRVVYPDMRAGDSVVVSWKGAVNHDSDAQTVSAQTELSFNVPKATILGNVGRPASVAYSVTRAGSSTGISAVLNLTVISSLELDASPVTLSGKIYLIPSSPNLLPTFPAGTTTQRQASGGQAPYTYSSSDEKVAVVDRNGLVQVRGKGNARITATDLQGQTKSYQVTVTGVIHCLGLGSGSFGQASTSAQGQGARLPSLEELREIYGAFGNRWPMGNGNYWSSTVAAANLAGMKWYFIKNLVTGAEFKLLHHNASLGVAIR